MRRALLMIAAGLILATNVWGVLQARRNRNELRGGKLELTERELHLEPIGVDSTATMLRLNWSVLKSGEKEYGPAVWLDAAKLAELGYDCALPLSSPSARRHYSSLPSRLVFLALEYEGEAWRNASAKGKEKTRLFVVDAALDASRLRERHQDPQRLIVCRGLVRLAFRDRDTRDGAALSTPRLEGWIEGLRPESVFVPLPQNRVLRGLSSEGSEGPGNSVPREPRFAARVCWGANYEPWVEAVRLLGVQDAQRKEP
jgi:hypothetical protein